MSTCPNCKNKLDKESKSWNYGKFKAHFYICQKCGAQFRDYTKDDKLSFTLILKDGKFRNANVIR